MAIEHAAWRPDWAVAPGEVLLEVLQERRMSQSELARRMGRPTKTINEIVNGKAAITPKTALQLELTLGITASVWTNLESKYRAHRARERARQELTANAAWADKFPIADLVRHELIQRGRTKGDTLAAVLSFFGVSSPDAWERKWLAPAASFRASPAFASDPPAVAAWLRWGEISGSDAVTEPFNSQRLRAVLPEIRLLTRQVDFMQAVGRVQALLASAGVVLVLTPEFARTRISGAARWLSSEKAVIQVSMRHKSNDQFWFSLFHEIGHLLARKRGDFVDAEEAAGDSSNLNESDADRFARDTLTPSDQYADFVASRIFTAQSVRDFAKRLGIAPGIVVGRLQRENLLSRSYLNDLKKPIRWAKAS
jgi:HTH-type transcriptional regulator/antitoxin HigA